jgi:hypothetical protein
VTQVTRAAAGINAEAVPGRASTSVLLPDRFIVWSKASDFNNLHTRLSLCDDLQSHRANNELLHDLRLPPRIK